MSLILRNLGKKLFLDVPGAVPQPITISDLSAEKCKLSWQPVANDGGSKVTNYIVEKFEVDHARWRPVR